MLNPSKSLTIDMASTTSTAITLRFDDDRQRVVVHPDDSDRFVMSASEAAKALRMFDQLDVMKFQAQFKALLDHLGTWLANHSDKVDRGIITRRDANLLFLVCASSPCYDSDLEDLLTELDIQVAADDDFSKIRLSVLSIPSSKDEAIAAFADPALYLEIKNAEQKCS